MITRKHLLRDLVWRLKRLIGKKAHSPEEILFRIKLLPETHGQERTFEFPWGPFVYISKSNLIGQFQEIYIDRHYAFSTKAPSPIIIDCGGNVGLSAIWFKQNYSGSFITVYEADPDLASILKRNIAASGLEGIDVKNLAVWTCTGEVSFNNAGTDVGSISDNGAVKVPCVDLATCLPERVDLLKFDIEGAEFAVLERMFALGVLPRVMNIVGELHIDRHLTAALGSIFKGLSESGYDVAMSSILGPWIGLTAEDARFEIVGRNRVLMQMYAWRK